jgi:hypothetical protein
MSSMPRHRTLGRARGRRLRGAYGDERYARTDRKFIV